MPRINDNWRTGVRTMTLLAADQKLLSNAAGCCQSIANNTVRHHPELCRQAEEAVKLLAELAKITTLDLTKPF